MRRDLRFEAFYPHLPAKVWRALTDPELIAKWLMPNDFQPRVGHSFRFEAPPQPGWDGKVHCTVLECIPNERLRYTWKNNLIDTILTITLREADGGTWLVLEHTGFAGWKGMMVSFILGSGWKGIVSKEIPRVIAEIE